MTATKSSLSFTDINTECIVALPEKNVPMVGKDTLFTYRPLAYCKGETVLNFTILHPILHVPGGIVSNGPIAAMTIELPGNDEISTELIHKYEEWYRACTNFVPDITSPLIASNSGYKLRVKIDKTTVITDNKGSPIPMKNLHDYQLWIRPQIQWEKILVTTKSIQLKLVSAELVDWYFKETQTITKILSQPYDSAVIEQLHEQIGALAARRQ